VASTAQTHVAHTAAKAFRNINISRCVYRLRQFAAANPSETAERNVGASINTLQLV